MQQSVETKRLPGNPKAWLAAIIFSGLTISIAAGWSSYLYGNILNMIFGWQAFTLVAVGVFIIAFVAMLLRWLVTLFLRWRGKTVERPVPGTWSFVWVSFQLACLLAVLSLGAVALLALAVGNAERMFQGFMLALVCSGLLFLAGGAVRETSRVVRLIRQ